MTSHQQHQQQLARPAPIGNITVARARAFSASSSEAYITAAQSPSRPPAQVFTRGTMGAVKTHRRQGGVLQRGASHSVSSLDLHQQHHHRSNGGRSRSTPSLPQPNNTMISPRSISSKSFILESSVSVHQEQQQQPMHDSTASYSSSYYYRGSGGLSDNTALESSDERTTIETTPSNTGGGHICGGSTGGGGGDHGSVQSSPSYGSSNNNGSTGIPRSRTRSRGKVVMEYSTSDDDDTNSPSAAQQQREPPPSPLRSPVFRSTTGGTGTNSTSNSTSGSPHYKEVVSLGAQSHEFDKAHVKTVRRVMDDLSRAQGSDRRTAALTYVCECFDHNDVVKHNVELSQGALQVLAKCLVVATHDDEVRMTCAALEMVLRASPRTVQLACSKVGGMALVVDLLRILERCESQSMTHADISILNISKLIWYLSKCTDLRIPLTRQQGVLESLQRVSTTQNPECRLARICTIANLANCEENKLLLFEYEGLVDNIVRIAHFDASDLARQNAASALMDICSAPQNQTAMASSDTVLGTLVKMTLVEKGLATREFVITALQNLAFCKENRDRIVSFRDGVVLEALKYSLANDLDAKARRRAAGAITNLVCDETAERMGGQKGLLDTLAIVSTKDDNLDVQTRASLALTKIANLITVEMECHEALLDALVVASLSNAANSVSAVLRIKARDPENRERMARHPGIMDTLSDICLSPLSKVNDRDNAMRAIMHLINEDRNRQILCTKTVLDALVMGANYKDADLEEARDSAVRAMERLATEHTNRETMARHAGLLTVVAQAVEREAKWEDAGRESEHGYLAKPLLMSLLVAM